VPPLLLRHGYNTELPKETQVIELPPPLDEFGIRETQDIDPRLCDSPLRCRDTKEFIGMRRSHREPASDPVVLGDHVINGEPHVDECGTEHAERVFDTLKPRALPGSGVVIDRVDGNVVVEIAKSPVVIASLSASYKRRADTLVDVILLQADCIVAIPCGGAPPLRCVKLATTTGLLNKKVRRFMLHSRWVTAHRTPPTAP